MYLILATRSSRKDIFKEFLRFTSQEYKSLDLYMKML
jgi:hypothetical protein